MDTKVRHVRTPAGVSHFHEPVGSPIVSHPRIGTSHHTREAEVESLKSGDHIVGKGQKIHHVDNVTVQGHEVKLRTSHPVTHADAKESKHKKGSKVKKIVAGLGMLGVMAGLAAAPAAIGHAMSPHDSGSTSVSQTVEHDLSKMPKKPAPTSAQGFANMFHTQVNPDEWGAADVSLSVPMKDGRSVWLYGDTFSNNWGMVHSTAITQEGGNLHVSDQGQQLLPNDAPTASGDKVVYWIEAAHESSPGHLSITAQRTRIGTKNVWDFSRVGSKSRVADATVTPSGDVKFNKWAGWTKAPKVVNTLYDLGEKHHFAYAKQAHPEFKLKDGNTLYTYAQNWDDGGMHYDANGNMAFKDYRPIFVDGDKKPIYGIKEQPVSTNIDRVTADMGFELLTKMINAYVETKVRHVRTPAGVAFFHEPIGSPIVDHPDASLGRSGGFGDHPTHADAAMAGSPRTQRLGVLKKVETDYEGWDKYQDGPITRYIGKQDGEVLVTDEHDNVLSAHKTKKEALAAMQEDYKTFDDGTPVKQFPRKATSGKYAKKPDAEKMKRDNLRHITSEQELQDYVAKYKHLGPNGTLSIPPNAKNVMINDNPNDPKSHLLAWYVQVGGEKDGKPQSRPKAATREANDAKKWVRIKAFGKDVPKVDDAISKADLSTDDDMAVIAMMRRTGARVGSDQSNDRASKAKHGISELYGDEVTFEGKTAIIGYPGKKYNAATGAGWQKYEIGDPQLVAMLKARKAKHKNGRLFPKATDKTAIARSRSITGAEYTNHDYRRLFATEQALLLAKAHKPKPKTAAQREAAMKKIGALVDEMLNDKNQALQSYVDPDVFNAAWGKGK